MEAAGFYTHVPVSAAVSAALAGLWLHALSQPAPEVTSEYRLGVWVTAAMVVLETAAQPLVILAQAMLFVKLKRRRRAAASSDDDRLAAFARDLSDSWYSDLPPKLDAGGVSTSNANKKSTFIRLFSHRVKRTTPRGRPANSNERSEGHTPIDFYCFVAYVPLPPLSQHNGVPVLRCRIEKRLVQRTDGCGPRDEPPPHTELRRADVKVELAAACSVPSTASTGSPAICGQKRRRFWDPAPWDQGVRARRCP
ncbi:Protein RFT1 [Amphibalanus amphitrite]|uniref:Protein RFT1 n=1 Tax=Amphibalanus amphitrite TaxID=1232801 RepID=A0A6A4VX25_AMPAM|nr:Protein RFT1 [Amphibalanus amphitrite]